MAKHETINQFTTEPLGKWLLAQRNRTDVIGDLAAAARKDPGFPSNGDFDAISARLNTVGADADMHEALELAELDWAAI